MLPRRIQVVEVGPRDGLQNETVSIAAGDKVAFVDRLTAAGHTEIEVAAFVSPRWVPQMADAAEVLAGIARRQGVRYSALVPNLTGLRRAREADVGDIAGNAGRTPAALPRLPCADCAPPTGDTEYRPVTSSRSRGRSTLHAPDVNGRGW